MPRRKTVEKYPSEYSRFFERASHGPVKINCESHSRAFALRRDLYNYRQAVYAKADETEEDEWLRAAIVASGLVFHVHGVFLIAEMEDTTSNVSLLRRAL